MVGSRPPPQGWRGPERGFSMRGGGSTRGSTGEYRTSVVREKGDGGAWRGCIREMEGGCTRCTTVSPSFCIDLQQTQILRGDGGVVHLVQNRASDWQTRSYDRPKVYQMYHAYQFSGRGGPPTHLTTTPWGAAGRGEGDERTGYRSGISATPPGSGDAAPTNAYPSVRLTEAAPHRHPTVGPSLYSASAGERKSENTKVGRLDSR